MKPIILDTTTKKLQIVMNNAATTTNPSYIVSYADVTNIFTEGNLSGTLNGTTPVDVVPAPTSSSRRIVTEIVVKNNDTASVTLYFQLEDGSVVYPIKTVTLAPDATWEMSASDGASGASASLPIDYISGLKLVWLADKSLQISSGVAVLPSGTVIQVNNAITLSDMSLTASAWYHLYLISDTNIEYSTIAPTSPYFGTARTKNGDTTRRYLGSFRTDADANIHKFNHTENMIRYFDRMFIYLILNNGTATTATTVSATELVPVSCQTAYIFLRNTASNGAIAYLSNIIDGIVVPGRGTVYIESLTKFYVFFPLSNDRTLQYAFDSTPNNNGLQIYCVGYLLER